MDTSAVGLVVRLIVSMAVVLAIMALLAWILRRRALGGSGDGAGPVEVLSRTQLSRSASLTVVRVGSRALVLGVTDHNVSVLADADPADFTATRWGGRPRLAAVTTGSAGDLNPAPLPVDAGGGTRTASAAGTAEVLTADAVETRARRDGTVASSAASGRSGSAWTGFVESLRERTVRRA